MMNQEEAIKKIMSKLGELSTIQALPRMSAEFKAWRREVLFILKKVFGEDSSQYDDFCNISFIHKGMSVGGDFTQDDLAFITGMKEAEAILYSLVREIEEYGIENKIVIHIEPLNALENIFNRFHLIVRQLRQRYSSRSTIDVQDEYDVQDLLHSLMRLHFDDIRPEEWSPSYAGKSNRMDFLLKEHEIVIEVKKTRDTLKEKELGDQLIIDIARYASHPNCKTLACFVYDPDGYIGNKAGVIGDLESQSKDGLIVKVYITPD